MQVATCEKHAGTHYLHILKADAWENQAGWREKHKIKY